MGNRAIIDRIFALPTVEAIRIALGADGSAFAQHAAAKMDADSPTSQKLAVRQIRAGAKLDFDACMRMEWRMVNRILAGHDFYEGVTAALIDTGRKPNWKPATLEEVSEAEVASYFAPLPGRELRFDWD